jgi:hypothetical protein
MDPAPPAPQSGHSQRHGSAVGSNCRPHTVGSRQGSGVEPGVSGARMKSGRVSLEQLAVRERQLVRHPGLCKQIRRLPRPAIAPGAGRGTCQLFTAAVWPLRAQDLGRRSARLRWASHISSPRLPTAKRGPSRPGRFMPEKPEDHPSCARHGAEAGDPRPARGGGGARTAEGGPGGSSGRPTKVDGGLRGEGNRPSESPGMARWLAASRRPRASGAWMGDRQEDPTAAKISVAAAFEGFPATVANAGCRRQPGPHLSLSSVNPTPHGPLSTVPFPRSSAHPPRHSLHRVAANGIPARMMEPEGVTPDREEGDS